MSFLSGVLQYCTLCTMIDKYFQIMWETVVDENPVKNENERVEEPIIVSSQAAHDGNSAAQQQSSFGMWDLFSLLIRGFRFEFIIVGLLGIFFWISYRSTNQMMVNVYTALNNSRAVQNTTASGPASSTPTPVGRNWNFFGKSSSSGDISGITQRFQRGKVESNQQFDPNGIIRAPSGSSSGSVNGGSTVNVLGSVGAGGIPGLSGATGISPARGIQIVNNYASIAQSPAKFEPARNDINSYLLEFELYLKIANIANNKKDTLLSFFSPSTRSMLYGIKFNDDDEIAYLELKQQMIKIFGKCGNSQVQYLRLFNTRNQEKYENVYTYSLKLRELAVKAIPNNPDADQMVLNQFIVGLRDRDLKTKLMTEEVRTLEEAIKRAVRLESIFANKVDDNFNQSGGVNQASGYSQSHGLGQTSGYNQSGQRGDTQFFNQQTVQPKVGQHQPYQNQSVPQQKLQQTSPQQQFHQANLQTSHPNASNPFNNKNNQSVRFQPNNNNLNSSLNNVGGN